MLAEREGVYVGVGSYFPGQNQFVLTTVKCALARRGLVPHDEVFEFSKCSSATSQKSLEMPPIGTDEGDRTICGDASDVSARLRKEVDIFVVGHFARCEGEFAMLHSPATLYVTGDSDIIRWICKHHPGPRPGEQQVEIRSRPCIPAQKAVIAQTPEITGARDGIFLNLRDGIAGVRFC